MFAGSVDEEEEPLFSELLHCPGESFAVRRRREGGFMIYLRETIVEFLRNRNVLSSWTMHASSLTSTDLTLHLPHPRLAR